MNYDNSWIYVCGFCCVYPIIGWALINFVIHRARQIDWTHIRLPWRAP